MVNKVILIGRLGADPEIRYTPSGAEVATFRIATSESWTNKSGEKEERTEWHRIVAWRGLAKICGEYLSKGKLVYIEGRLRTRAWEDRDGNKRSTTEIEASDMKMLSGPCRPVVTRRCAAAASSWRRAASGTRARAFCTAASVELK